MKSKETKDKVEVTWRTLLFSSKKYDDKSQKKIVKARKTSGIKRSIELKNYF